jgi:glycogen(starch) synthase
MKILMTADPIGGVWRYALELCEALQPYAVQVTLATLGAELSSAQRLEAQRLPNVDLRESHFRLEWMSSPWESLSEAATWLLSLEREVQPTVIHLNHLVHADLPWNAPVMVVGHSCVFSWWHAVHGQAPPDEWSRYRERVASSLHAANLVVAPTQAMMRSLHRHYGTLYRCQVIANGLDARRFRTGRKEPLILSAGRLWDAGKNVNALAQAAPEVWWPIAVAGAQTSPDGSTSSLDGIQSLGALPATELSRWYSRAAIYALPARYEPFGLTALEAALSGCALVLGDIESLREVWGASARYVPPDDSTALREALNRFSADPDSLHTFAALAHARASLYSAEHLAAEYWNAYRSLLGSASLDAPLPNTKDIRKCVSYSSTIH